MTVSVDALQAAAMTPRWHHAVLSPMQLGYLDSINRINVVVAGRRSFKTEGAKRRLVSRAIEFCDFPDGRFFACAPTQQQAKTIFWEDLKALTPKWALRTKNPHRDINESSLEIKLWNGAVLKVAGLDKPQRVEGKDWDGGVISEYGDVKKSAFIEHIRPMMVRGGYIDIEGVPEGRNHYYELVRAIRADDGSYPDARVHQWTTEEVLHLWLGKEAADAEIKAAMATMDTHTYNQEYRAEFVSFAGRAYYEFDESKNCPPVGESVDYDPREPLILCMDFNRSPGVALVCQEHDPRKYPWLKKHGHTVTAVLDEVWIERGSNTKKVSQRFAEKWADIAKGKELLVYGDATGGAKKTVSKDDESDWDIVESVLKPIWGHGYKDRVAKSNPPVRSRLNRVNSRLCSVDGTIGTVINAARCRHFVNDLDGCEADDAGDLVKENDSMLTHMSDAFGYYVHEAEPSREPGSGGLQQ